MFPVPLLFMVAICVIYFATQKPKSNLPPGPWGLPIVGHLPFVGSFPAKKFLEWKKAYGPIFFIKFGSYDVIVLNNKKLVKEAFNREEMCGRPLLVNTMEMTRSKGIGWVDGPRQSEHRKFAIKFFRDNESSSSRDFRLQQIISDFLNKLKTQCTDSKGTSGKSSAFRINNFFRFPVINTMWEVILGRRFEEGDPVLEKFMEAFETFSDLTSSFGALRWFFPIPSKLLCLIGCNPAVSGMREVYDYMARLIEQGREDYVAGVPKNMAHAYFDRIAVTTDPQSAFYKQRQEHVVAIGDMYFATIDTTTVTLDWFLLYMATSPSVQSKLHQEIDTVIGTDASDVPSLSQRTQMPYTQAVIQEILRISSVVPLAILHRAVEHVEFHGYSIPKNAIIIPNLYGIHHDPDIWHEPNKFLPERFLGEDGSFQSPHPILAFSTGKRQCIGEEFARDEIFLFITHFMKVFTVFCTKNPPTLDPSVSSTLVSPQPFEVVLQQRK